MLPQSWVRLHGRGQRMVAKKTLKMLPLESGIWHEFRASLMETTFSEWGKCVQFDPFWKLLPSPKPGKVQCLSNSTSRAEHKVPSRQSRKPQGWANKVKPFPEQIRQSAFPKQREIAYLLCSKNWTWDNYKIAAEETILNYRVLSSCRDWVFSAGSSNALM